MSLRLDRIERLEKRDVEALLEHGAGERQGGSDVMIGNPVTLGRCRCRGSPRS